MKKLISFIALGLFVIALAINVNSSLKDPFSLTSLAIIAQTSGGGSSSGGGGSSGPQGKVCGPDGCEVSYSVGVYTVTEYGSYYHCKLAESGNCSSSSCDRRCDAI